MRYRVFSLRGLYRLLSKRLSHTLAFNPIESEEKIVSLLISAVRGRVPLFANSFSLQASFVF
jgi:hypothetical protein